jgi:hypothetical protein
LLLRPVAKVIVESTRSHTFAWVADSADVSVVRKRTGKRAYEPLVGRLPPRVAARLDLIAPWIAKAWGGPLNGQVKRAEIFREIIEGFSFCAIVETGTYRGTSTDFLRRVSGLPVYSVERNPRFFEYSRLRFRNDSDVAVRLGDSRDFLRDLAADTKVPHERLSHKPRFVGVCRPGRQGRFGERPCS